MKRINMNIEVACRVTEDVLLALEEQQNITGYDQEDIGRFQIMFDLRVRYNNDETYHEVMQRVESAVRRYMQKHFSLDEDSLIGATVRADWKNWEKSTGRDHAAESSTKQRYKDGIFVMAGYFDEMENLRRLGVTQSHLMMQTLWDYKFKSKCVENHWK